MSAKSAHCTNGTGPPRGSLESLGSSALKAGRSPMSLDDLSPAHRNILEKASGIRTDIIDVRRYRTASTAADLRRLGFSESQRIVPALVIPIINVYGETALYQWRPDRPRMLRGRM